MEEEAARQAASNPPAPAAPASAAAPSAAPTATAVAGLDIGGGVGVSSAQQQHSSGSAAPATDEGEEALLQQALALSEARGGAAPDDVEMTEDPDRDENLTEEEMIARAIEMSMRPEPESEEKK